jgi:uncharacterized protein YfdQ (DUF2303 family)
MIDEQAVELLLSTGRNQQAVNENPAGDPFFITPGGEARGLVGFFPPRRISETPTFIDAGSFVQYVNRFKTEDSLIFALVTEASATLTAVLDYHKPKGAKPDYCRHRATFKTLPTPEWAAWSNANRKPMDQVTFATWLEDNLNLFVQPKDETGKPDKTVPSGAELLELVQTLHGHQNARFNTQVRLQTGAYSVNYEEDVDVKGSVCGGVIALPPKIVGGFAIFQGGDAFQVPARLKVRVTERKMMLHFETIGVPQLIRDNLIGDDEHPGIVRKIATDTGIMPLLGSV